jgi:hypothetical protein
MCDEFVWSSNTEPLSYLNKQSLYQSLHRYANSDYDDDYINALLTRRFLCIRFTMRQYDYSHAYLKLQIALLYLEIFDPSYDYCLNMRMYRIAN